jgi:hypothetical protein
MGVKEYGGRTYYQFELDGPHMLVSATAAGNRLYLMSLTANGTYMIPHFVHFVACLFFTIKSYTNISRATALEDEFFTWILITFQINIWATCMVNPTNI